MSRAYVYVLLRVCLCVRVSMDVVACVFERES